jgi:hypothetical protein
VKVTDRFVAGSRYSTSGELAENGSGPLIAGVVIVTSAGPETRTPERPAAERRIRELEDQIDQLRAEVERLRRED